MNYALIARIANLTDENWQLRLMGAEEGYYASLVRENLEKLFEKIDEISKTAFGDYDPEYPEFLKITNETNMIFRLDGNILALLRGIEKDAVYFEDYIFLAALFIMLFDKDNKIKASINSYIDYGENKEFQHINIENCRKEFVQIINKIYDNLLKILKTHTRMESSRNDKSKKYHNKDEDRLYKLLIGRTNKTVIKKSIDFVELCNIENWKKQAEFYACNFEYLLSILNTQYYELFIYKLEHATNILRSALRGELCVRVINKHKKNIYPFIADVKDAAKEEFELCKSLSKDFLENLEKHREEKKKG